MSADGQDAGGVVQWLQKEPAKLKEKFESWLAQQPYAATVALITLGGGTQGAVLGAVMGSLAKAQPAAGQGVSPLASNPAMTGGPLVQARNFGVLTGVNAGLSATVKKLRGGVDDVQTAMIASFGSGIAFSLVSGIGTSVNQPGGPVPAALVTGTMFALFQGAFYKIGEMFGWTGTAAGTPAEDTYLRTRYMLSTLGLEKYEKNFKKGLLDDSTLMLLNENALAECKIPPGPRLHIMNHIESYRNVLKPGMMLPAPPPPEDPSGPEGKPK
uniref:Mitochondrial import inner membrane translocase subunit tim17 tim22 tim23 family protein n=1 Tax=Tetraselmis sp. GSL018 TaxID=582737 RepID=A0A061R190_9CHLO